MYPEDLLNSSRWVCVGRFDFATCFFFPPFFLVLFFSSCFYLHLLVLVVGAPSPFKMFARGSFECERPSWRAACCARRTDASAF